MYENINFLRERVRLQEAVLQSDKRIALFTSLGLGIFLTIVVGIVSYSFFLASQLSALQAGIVDADNRLASLAKIESAYAQRKSMLSLSRLVMEKRTKAWDAISYLYTLIPKESTIESINLSGVDESLEFTVKSPTVFAYKQLSTILQSDQVANGGYQTTLGALDRRKDGSYSLEVRLFISAPTPVATTPDTSTSVEVPTP